MEPLLQETIKKYGTANAKQLLWNLFNGKENKFSYQMFSDMVDEMHRRHIFRNSISMESALKRYKQKKNVPRPTRQSRPNSYRRNRAKTIKRDGKCLKCGEGNFLLLTVDHITPVSKGGGNDQDNLQTLCEKCNQEKGDKTINYR